MKQPPLSFSQPPYFAAEEEQGPGGRWDTGVTALCTEGLPDTIREAAFSFYQHTRGLRPVLPQIRLVEF